MSLALIEKVAELAEAIVNELSLELVDVESAFESGRNIVRVYIDKSDGVTIDDCTKVSRAISIALDVEDIVRDRYSLEVSSPGLDRPLKKIEDFTAAIGKVINLKTKEPVQGRRNFKATVVGVKDGIIEIEDMDGFSFEFTLDNLLKARLEIEIRR